MKIIMAGTGPFAVPTFRWLLESPHDVPLLVTRPIEDAGRRRKQPANPMRELAEARSVPVVDPANINDVRAIEELRAMHADLMVVCDYGQILSRAALSVTRLGGVNLHGSLLPRYRGAAPVNWAIWHGETESGVTAIHMTPRLDGGPILASQVVAIETGETAPQLELRLAEAGVDVVRRAIELLDTCTGAEPPGEPQQSDLATPAPRLRKEDGRLDWSRTARQLFNQVRALQPWPGSYTTWSGGGEPLRLIVWRAATLDAPCHAAPGTVIAVSDDGIDVATGEGVLRLLELQPAGKRAMSAADFLRGRSLASGALLGEPA